MKPLYLVLPCYNEELSLQSLIDRALQCAKKRGLASENFQLVLVENGSKDKSLQVMQELQSRPEYINWIRIVPVKVNQGYGYGLWQGLKSIPKGTIAAWTHADEQCDPEDAFVGWEKVRGEEKNILIKGTRHGRDFKDRVISWGFELIATLLFLKRFHEINAQPKVFKAELLDKILAPPFDFSFDFYVLAQALRSGYSIVEIPVEFPSRKHGESKWANTFKSKMRQILRTLKYMFLLRMGKA